MTGPLDRAVDFLMRPRVRRLRRWSFLLTGPVTVLVALRFGVSSAAWVVALRVLLWAAVVWWAWRLKGERGEAVRDLLAHPRARALMRAEVDVWLTVPRLLAGASRRARAGMAYHRGSDDLAIGLAFLGPLLAEGAVVHLLLPPEWLIAHVVNAALHLYLLLWLVALSLGRRAWPHAVRRGMLVVRNGPLHRACVPLAAIESAFVHRERVTGEGGLHARDGDGGPLVLLPARRRVDVRLVLREPVRVTRPLADPVWATELAFPTDDPEALLAELRELPERSGEVAAGLAALGALDALAPA